jgi:glycosyltransferase involved in cell wall biosynthesis
VHNAVDLAEFQLGLLTQRAQLRHSLGLPVDAQVLVVLGSVQRVKGHWLLLHVLRELTDTELVLVGGGVSDGYARTWRGRIKRTLRRPLDNLDALLRDARALGVESRIHVTGFRRDVARVLAVGDALVFPSLEPEGFGRPIIEGMAMARPVIATDVGPSAELLGSEAGILVPPDVESVASAVRDVLAAPEMAARMGAAGRRRVEACFSLDRQVAAMQSIYAEATIG